MNLARSRWGTQTAAIVILALYSSISLALPSYQGKIIDKIVKNNRQQFYVATRTYLVFMLVQGALRATYSAMFSIVSRSILYEIRTKLFESIVRQDIAFFDGRYAFSIGVILASPMLFRRNDIRALVLSVD